MGVLTVRPDSTLQMRLPSSSSAVYVGRQGVDRVMSARVVWDMQGQDVFSCGDIVLALWTVPHPELLEFRVDC